MKKAASVFVFALAAVAASPLLAAESFTVDSNHTWPYFEVNHLGFSTQRGRFNKTNGKITLDTAAKKGSVDITIDTNSVDMGLEKWDTHMKDEDFFNVEKFPTMTFKSEAFKFEGNKPVSAVGMLTLLGTSKPIKLTISNFVCGANPITKKPLCAADISSTIKRSDWGMTKYVPGVSDEVKITIPVEAYKD